MCKLGDGNGKLWRCEELVMVDIVRGSVAGSNIDGYVPTNEDARIFLRLSYDTNMTKISRTTTPTFTCRVARCHGDHPFPFQIVTSTSSTFHYSRVTARCVYCHLSTKIR